MKNLKLGKLPKREDRLKRTLKLSTVLPVLPPLPAVIDWTGKVPDWKMLGNDLIGNCTCAAAGHSEMLWTSQASQEFIPTDADILTAYQAVSGYDPSKTDSDGNNPTDTGADMLTVQNYWRNTGIAGHKIGAYAALNVAKLDEFRASVYLFGASNIGIQMPQSAMDATNSGTIWTELGDTDIVGGHDIILVAYDANGFWSITWGQKQYMTNEWLLGYTDEAYCPFSQDFINGTTGVSPSGFNMQKLQEYLASL